MARCIESAAAWKTCSTTPSGIWRLWPTILSTALGFGSCALPLAAVEDAGGGANNPGELQSEPGSGPDRLKEQVRVTVETNAAPADVVALTNPPPKSLTWDVGWKRWDGLHFSLDRKTFLGQQVNNVTNLQVIHLEEARMAGKIGLKLAVDAAAFLTEESLGVFDNGVELRRARIYTKGDCLILLPVSYEFEVGYVPGSFYIENSYLEFHGLGFLGTLKGGQFQPPMSLANYASSRDTTFMETATPLQALAPGVNAGIQIGRPVLNERMTWAMGLFTDSVGEDFGDATTGFGRAVGRVTGLPVYHYDPESPSAQRLLHLGLSGSVLYAHESSVRYQSRPESHLAPFVVDTGEISADGAAIVGLEAAWVQGPLCVSAEGLHSWVRGRDGPDVDFGGYYASVSWLLTGESRPYDRDLGTFGRLVPRRNFDPRDGGWGAFELAGRFSHLDLNSSDVSGGRINMFMFGLNWYLHPHVKWRFNYGLGEVGGRVPEGAFNIFQTRFEVDF